MSSQGSETVVLKSVLVQWDVETAFRIWTEEIDRWWPKGHSLSGDRNATIHLEGEVGGRFYERTPEGTEFDLGEVLEWDPPARLTHTWYLGSNQGPPTRVNVRFSPHESGGARIMVEHRGPELIGELWWLNKTRFSAAWDVVLGAYTADINSP